VHRRADPAAFARHVLAGQLCFVAMMLSCCLIEPSGTALRQGLSYYGNHLQTIAPYAAAFTLAIGLTARGLWRLGGRHGRFYVAVGAVLVLMVPIPLTPYELDAFFDWTHLAAAGILFAAGYAVGAWLALGIIRSPRGHLLFGALSLAGLAILTAELGLHAYMIPSEIAFQLAFAALLLLAGMRLAASVPGLPATGPMPALTLAATLRPCPPAVPAGGGRCSEGRGRSRSPP
jgi:hypothetical protein